MLVLDAFPPKERGKGLAIFFIVTGLFTAVGPVAGAYLTEYWTWRAIFWINVPVAILALAELYFAKLRDIKNPARIDVRGAILGPWLAVFFFGSYYFQVAVRQEPTEAGFSILTMFYSFFVAARIGGGWMDKFGAKKPVALGFIAATVGMILWAS